MLTFNLASAVVLMTVGYFGINAMVKESKKLAKKAEERIMNELEKRKN